MSAVPLPPSRAFSEKQGHRFKKETSWPVGIIPQIQKSIDGWVGKSIGSQCYAFIREGDLQKVRHSPNIAGECSSALRPLDCSISDLSVFL